MTEFDLSPRYQRLLDEVIAFYLDSGDFNGLAIYAPEDVDVHAASELVAKGLVQVVSDEDFLNPHVRPWKSKRSVEDQIDSLQRLQINEYMVCLYPTEASLVNYDFGDRYNTRPYHRRMAEGKGTLELAYFDSVPGSGGLRIWRGSRIAINESC